MMLEILTVLWKTSNIIVDSLCNISPSLMTLWSQTSSMQLLIASIPTVMMDHTKWWLQEDYRQFEIVAIYSIKSGHGSLSVGVWPPAGITSFPST
jgi:hypothetical protein